MNLIRLLSGCFAAAFMVGCSTVSVSKPEKATDAYTDLCDPAACKMSNDGLPATTNGVLRAWLEADQATVQEKMYNAMRKVLAEGEIHYVEDVTNHTLKATLASEAILQGDVERFRDFMSSGVPIVQKGFDAVLSVALGIKTAEEACKKE